MTNSKILRVVLSLNELEVSLFTKFINSPYFNEKKELILFWNWISINKNNLSEESKFIAWNKIFPNKAFNDGAMRKLMNKLNDSIKEFLIIQHHKNDTWLSEKTLLRCYGEKNLTKEFRNTMTDLKKKLTLTSENEYDYNYELFEISKIFYSHPSTSKLKPEVEVLSEAMNQLDQFYITNKLFLATEKKNRKIIFPKIDSILFLEEIKNHIQNGKPEKVDELYLKLQSIFETGYNKSDFSKCELLFSQIKKTLSPKNRHAILIFMINIIIREINLGATELAEKNHELFSLGIKEKILIPNNQITHETFTNVVTFAANLGHKNYAKNFIKNYSKYLDPEIRSVAVSFCIALISFYNKDYLDTITRLTNYKNNGEYFDLRARSFLIRALVEQYLIDPNFYLLFNKKTKSIDRYLRRKQSLGEKRVKGYLKLLSFSVKLVNLLQTGKAQPKDWERLYKKIENQQFLYARKWLLNSINLVKNN